MRCAAALVLCGLSRVRAGKTAPPPRARPPPVADHDRYAAGRPARRVGATVATPNLDRLAREGAMAMHASAPVPLTRPRMCRSLPVLPRRARHSRQRLAARQERARDRRNPAAARIPDRRIRLVDRAVEAVGAEPRVRPLRRSVRHRRRRCPVSQYHPETRGRHRRRSRGVARRARAGTPLRVGPPV